MNVYILGTFSCNWKICELLYDITSNVISGGTFPIYRVWSSHQMMFFTIARLHTRLRNQYYISTTTA